MNAIITMASEGRGRQLASGICQSAQRRALHVQMLARGLPFGAIDGGAPSTAPKSERQSDVASCEAVIFRQLAEARHMRARCHAEASRCGCCDAPACHVQRRRDVPREVPLGIDKTWHAGASTLRHGTRWHRAFSRQLPSSRLVNPRSAIACWSRRGGSTGCRGPCRRWSGSGR